MHTLFKKADLLTRIVISEAIDIHEYFGPGLLESVYVRCLEQALHIRGIKTAREVHVPIKYKGLSFEEKLRVDLLVDECLIIEAKAVENPNTILFKKQVLSYMKLMNLPLGLVLNFGGTTMRSKNIWRVILKGADSVDSNVKG